MTALAPPAGPADQRAPLDRYNAGELDLPGYLAQAAAARAGRPAGHGRPDPAAGFVLVLG